MSLDTELEAWRREWQSESAVPPDLLHRVGRQSRRLKIGLIADSAVTIAVGGGVIFFALRERGPGMPLLVAATWTFIAAAWAFRLITLRGAWRAATADTAGFVALSIRRCRAQMKATIFGAVLYVCEIVFCLGWIYEHAAIRTRLLPWLAGSPWQWTVWIATVVFFACLIWYRRRKRAEIAWLERLRNQAA